METGDVLIETSRLVLRELRPDDLDFVASMLAHPEVMRFWPRPYSREEARDWIRDQRDRYGRHGHGYWLAVERVTGRPVGQAGVLTLEVDGAEEVSLGWILHRPFWRRCFATEAARGCLRYAFDTLGERYVIAPIRPENIPSQRVALKLGMEKEARTTYRAGLLHLIFSITQPAGEP